MVGETPPTSFRFSTLAAQVYGFPAYMVLVGVIPIVNAFFYSSHGGIGWLVLPFTFPYVLVRLGIALWRSHPSNRRRLGRFATLSIPGYIALTAPLSWAATYSINSWLGTSLHWTQFWALMLLPVSLLGLLFQ
ncbi:MAG: hypothetical protein XU15_C0031G0004 [candidate division NC10 bacterium CSP1-5]|nr:MAG: hypothetical protein XU15_C0031G0004 [candidate division NC10 bacterium CSP1-5]